MSKSTDCNSRESVIPATTRESDESSPNHFVREIKAVLHSSIDTFSPIWNDCSDLAKAFTCSLRAGLFQRCDRAIRVSFLVRRVFNESTLSRESNFVWVSSIQGVPRVAVVIGVDTWRS